MCNYQRLCSVLYKQYYIYAGFISSKSLSLSSFVCMCMKLFEPSLFLLILHCKGAVYLFIILFLQLIPK